MRAFRLSPLALTAMTGVLALSLSACGGGDDPTITADGAGTPSDAGASAQFNDADVAFVRGMVPHHSGAVEMAELAATRAADPQVKDLADRIAAAQQPEIEELQAMAEAWGVDLAAPAGGEQMPGMDMSGEGGEGGEQMPGMEGEMSSEADVAALEPLTGEQFDREFLTRMIAHHESAIAMAESELADGVSPKAQEMAQEIVRVQTAEIAEMRGLLAA